MGASTSVNRGGVVYVEHTWVHSQPFAALPPFAVVGGHDCDGSPIYVGRAYHEDTYRWVHSSAYSSIPAGAIIGGNDADGAVIYVGRAFHNGDTLVAKVIPSKHIAFVSWRGEVIPKEHFEILCGENLVWDHCYDHVVPNHAILCGETALGQPIYIGRGHYNGSLTVGKISSVHRALFIAFAGTERRLESYEILVEQKKPLPGWAIPTALEEKKLPLPPPILVALEEDFKQNIPTSPPPPPPPLAYVPLYPPEEIIRPTNVTQNDQARPFDAPPPYTAMPMPMQTPNYTQPYGSLPAQKFSYTQGHAPPVESFPEKKFTYAENYAPPSQLATVTPAENYVPPMAATVTQAETYMPPAAPITFPADMWVPASGGYTPPRAVHAGNEANFAPIYACRAFHDGNMVPGKFVPSQGCAYIGMNGIEIPKYDYEVLVGERYRWAAAYGRNVPPGAVEAGRTISGEPLFIGRTHHMGSLVSGKVQRSHGCLYIPYGGREIPMMNFEILVRSQFSY